MRRFFARNLLFVVFVNLLVKPVWIFLIDRTVQNRVGNASYGLYIALFNLGIIFLMLLDFGLNNYNSSTISRDPGKLRQTFPAMASARVILTIIYVFVVCGVGWGLGYRGPELVMLFGVLVIQSLNSVLQFIRSNIAALQKFRIDGLLSVLDRFLMIIFCGALLLYPMTAGQFQIEWFIEIQIACYAIAIVIGLVIMKRISDIPLRLSLDIKTVIGVIRKSAPYALLIFLMALYTRADMPMIERLCGETGKEQAGVYAHAYRLLDVGNMFGLMFAGILLPLFVRMLAGGQNVQPIVQLCTRVLLPGSLIMTASGVFFGDEIMRMLYHTANETDGRVFMWLMIAFPAFSLTNIYSTLLTANGSLGLLNKIAFGGVVINLTLNFILIPRYQSLGAAISACITQGFLAVCFSLFAQKQLLPEKDMKGVMIFVLYLVLLFGIGYGITLLPLSWGVAWGLLLLSGVLLMSAFRFVSFKALYDLKNPG